MTTGYILCSFGTFFTVLVSCAKKNLATLFEGCGWHGLEAGLRHKNGNLMK
jgi:hypothetical protein